MLAIVLVFLSIQFCSSVEKYVSLNVDGRREFIADWTVTGGWVFDFNSFGKTNAYDKSSIGTLSDLTTGFWNCTPARRLKLTATVDPTLPCSNENDTSCLIQLAYMKSNNSAETPTYIESNITFPNKTFLDKNTTTTTVFINGMANTDGIFIRFRATGFSGSIHSIELGYYECPSVTANLVDFPLKPAPDELEVERKIYGTCAANADLEGTDRPYMMCKYDSTYKVTGRCVCKAGYQPKDGRCDRK